MYICTILHRVIFMWRQGIFFAGMTSMTRAREAVIRSTVRYSIFLCHAIIPAKGWKHRNGTSLGTQLVFVSLPRIRAWEYDVVFGLLRGICLFYMQTCIHEHTTATLERLRWWERKKSVLVFFILKEKRFCFPRNSQDEIENVASSSMPNSKAEKRWKNCSYK